MSLGVLVELGAGAQICGFQINCEQGALSPGSQVEWECVREALYRGLQV